jgi:Rieske Fe-S protein
MRGLSRREFVAGLAGACLSCGCGGPAEKTRPLEPAPDPGPADPPSPPPDGGLIAVPDAVRSLDTQMKLELPSGDEILLWHDRAGFHAVQSSCTHRGGEVFWDRATNQIQCPSHGSRFYFDGGVARGPAKEPLRVWRVREERGGLRIEKC